ncbi:unnamed protein product [Clavelina lepadiformis]|uniref:Uncharacterized protein n=1 Tax=Clavelina lepadiformis TaxID=159417 RepID=A0ABP0FRZ5_CLALP
MSKELQSVFEAYSAQGVGNVKGKAAGLNNKNFVKLCKDHILSSDANKGKKKITTTDADIDFSKHVTKGAKTLTLQQFENLLLVWGEKIYGVGKEKEIFSLVVDKKPMAKGVTKTSKTGGVEKMTDTSGYTGSHKQRFGEDGKGLGAAGRADIAENSGYVGNYKGQGTYEKKADN